VLLTLSAVTPAASLFVIAPTAISALGGASLIAFVGGALLCLGCAMCYAELASALPLAGGEYSYAARILGAGAGSAVLGSAVVSVVLIVASLSLGAGDLVTATTDRGSARLVAVAVVVAGTLIASLRVRVGARLTGAFLMLEIGTLAAVSLLGFCHVSRSLMEAVSTGPASLDPALALGLAVVAQLPTAVFAFNGFASGVFLTEDLRQARSAVPRMIYTSLLLVVAVELTPLVALLVGAPSIEAMAQSPSPIAYFVEVRGGRAAASWLLPAIALAIVNAVIAIIMQASRLVFTAARDGATAPRVDGQLAQLDRRTGTPVRAALLVGVLSIAALALVPPSALLTLTSSTLLVPGAAVAASSMVGRRRGTTGVDAYRMPAWPLPPIVTLATTTGIAVVQWRTDELRILGPFAVFVVAFAVGVVRQRRRGRS
jgi:amino acid transporter